LKKERGKPNRPPLGTNSAWEEPEHRFVVRGELRSGVHTLFVTSESVIAFGSQDLGFRTWINGSQDLGFRFHRPMFGPVSYLFSRHLFQDLGFRTSINGHWVSFSRPRYLTFRTWVSGPR
jgi:hypothetical protein